MIFQPSSRVRFQVSDWEVRNSVRGGGFLQNIIPPGDPVFGTVFCVWALAIGNMWYLFGFLLLLSASRLLRPLRGVCVGNAEA